MGDVVFGAKTGYLLAGKISSVVGDDCVRDSEATHYVLPEKFDNLLPTDFRERYYLDPFGKIVGGYQQQIQLVLHLGERSDYVESPLHKEPWPAQGVKVRARLV